MIKIRAKLCTQIEHLPLHQVMRFPTSYFLRMSLSFTPLFDVSVGSETRTAKIGKPKKKSRNLVTSLR